MVYIDDQTDRIDLEEVLPTISSQRRQQALRFRFEEGRRQSVAAYLLLKRALREEEGITENPVFEYGEHGKPSIVGHPELFFSLSHCREAVACVLGRSPVGIDVERVGRYRENVARHVMNDREMEQICQSEHPDVMFTRLWTMKESLLKMTGEGINDRVKHVLDDISRVRFSTTCRLERNYIVTVCEKRS